MFVAPASAQTGEWTFCANEGEICAFTGTAQVRYGANGSYVYKTLSGGVACTNTVFGDPIYGVVKTCDFLNEWTFCASEGGFCAFTGTREVRYGAADSHFYKTLTDGTACTNSVFGDPIYGTVKQCATRAAAPPPTGTDWTFCASEGGTCAFTGTREVRYGAAGSYFYNTLFEGTACTNAVFGDPVYGVFKQCHTRATVPAPTARGPSPEITCPTGAVDLWPGDAIPQIVGLHPAGTTFCLRAGLHSLTRPIVPKSGDTFVGEYGAVIDGTGWTPTDTTLAAFRAHQEDIDYVTIRNLVIRNMYQRGIHAFAAKSDHWTIERNEIAYNGSGVVFPSDSVLRNNFIHHNTVGGYLASYSHNSIVEGNEISYNGWEQKIGQSANVTFRNNFVHHNSGDGIWYDSNNTGALIEGNQVEDNGEMGIFYEISADAVIRNNIIRRSRDTAVFISTSKDVEIYNNRLEDNFRGITYFVNCHSVGGGTIEGGYDLRNNSAHDNTIVVGTQSGAFASVFSYTLCDSAQLAPYENGSTNLSFSQNTYDVPSPSTGRYWFWNGPKYWNEWQALGRDLDSIVQ
jgi:parallel beta-helix repeat protein